MARVGEPMSRSREQRIRFVALYVALPPILAIAALILGRYTWLTASQYSQLGEETIIESTVILANEAVSRVERTIIAADHAVIALVDLEAPSDISEAWRPRAVELSPSVRAVVILDADANVEGFSIRGNDRDKWSFLYLLREKVRPDLELETLVPGRLKHLHKSYSGQSYLFTVECVMKGEERHYVVLHHDTGYLVREELAQLFSTQEAQEQYNVIDVDTNRIVTGRDLRHAGNYLVGIRFPTTLYSWRLQVAPTRASELGERDARRRVIESVLIGSSFAVLLFGVVSLLVAAHNERQLSNMKSEFIANVSHELKTPLSVVRMFGEMLLTNRVKSDEKRQQYLEIIVRESERLTSLIENVLDFSRLERGKREYEKRDGDLVAAVKKAIDAFRYRMEHEGVEVSFHPDDDIPETSFDEQSVVLAVINLLDNAVKYGGRTGVDVSVMNKGRWIQIDVRDRGPGIPGEDLKKVFERFFRTERDRQTRGSGIGLALVKHIAEAHGGRAFANNSPAGGAIVSFSISTKPDVGKGPRGSLTPPDVGLSGTPRQ
jgi:two-component system phosphate regulon sensor histidine kinase PhoR